MKQNKQKLSFKLSPIDNRRLANLCGQFDENLRHIEDHLKVSISNRGHVFQITGHKDAIQKASDVLNTLYDETQDGDQVTADKVHLLLQTHSVTGKHKINADLDTEDLEIPIKYGVIKPRGANQQFYVENILTHDINFGIGPAGTGKTYLAVACAIAALEKHRVRRIILCRPAVEAGERLGFLPGDLTQKVDPYFRPLYDALYEMLGFERVSKLIERQVIEIAPLAYMRGRTLNDSFIILDESQNTTREQMKMFLTRIGFNSIAVITGDTTQVDLPRGTPSGLHHALKVLKKVPGISVTHFQSSDVVRHPLVQAIVNAYAKHEETSAKPLE